MAKMPEPDDFPEFEIVVEFYVHIIFWTTKLRPSLSPMVWAKACEALDQAMFTIEGEALAAGGAKEHIHILVRVSPEHTVQEALDTLRARSAALVTQVCGVKGFAWNESQVAVSIGTDDLPAAKAFIEGQASHHEHVTFQTELKAIFDENGFDYDEQDLWGQ